MSHKWPVRENFMLLWCRGLTRKPLAVWLQLQSWSRKENPPYTRSIMCTPMLALVTVMRSWFSTPPLPLTVFGVHAYINVYFVAPYCFNFPSLCGELCQNLSILSISLTPTLSISIGVFIIRLWPEGTVLYVWESFVKKLLHFLMQYCQQYNLLTER